MQLTGGVVVHDAALEALVDEVAVGRVVGWIAGRRPPDLEVETWQKVLLAGLTGERVLARDGGREGLVVVDGLALEGIRCHLLREGDDGRVVVGIAHRRRRGDHRGVRRRVGAAIDPRVRHQARIEQVERLHRAIRLQLHDQSLKDLHLEADQPELARDRVAEGWNTTASLEEVPEGIVVDSIARLRKVPRVGGLRPCAI